MSYFILHEIKWHIKLTKPMLPQHEIQCNFLKTIKTNEKLIK